MKHNLLICRFNLRYESVGDKNYMKTQLPLLPVKQHYPATKSVADDGTNCIPRIICPLPSQQRVVENM